MVEAYAAPGMGKKACGQAGEGKTPLLASHASLHAQDEREASGGVSNVDMDGNTTLQSTAIKVVIAAFETRLVPAPEYRPSVAAM
jgi:hypothetical protein